MSDLSTAWRTIKTLGEGGQGYIHLVERRDGPTTGPFVAKVLKNPRRLHRMEAEREALLRLAHPRIIKIEDADFECSKPYIVMEYCSRGDLRQCASDIVRMDLLARLSLFDGLAEGVQHAHTQGVIHRDIKPDNVFLADAGGVKLGDFGLCFLAERDSRLSATGEAVGSRLYMAPELADGPSDIVSPAVDVYSLGKVLYWLLAQREFDREKHRENAWSLALPEVSRTLSTPSWAMEHVNLLLDQMITVAPERRLTMAAVREKVVQLHELIAHRYAPIGLIPTRCQYCGRGEYRRLSVQESAGLGPVYGGHPQVRLVCSQCGHCQFFLLNHAEQRSKWQP